MSAMFEIEMRFFTQDGGNDPAQFEEFLDGVVDEFANQGFDVDYTAAASALEVADGTEDALIHALTALRTVLAAVGIETEGLGGHEVMSTRKLAMA